VFYYLQSGTAGEVEETRKCPTITNDLDGVHAMQCIHSFTFLLRPLNSGVPWTVLYKRMKTKTQGEAVEISSHLGQDRTGQDRAV